MGGGKIGICCSAEDFRKEPKRSAKFSGGEAKKSAAIDEGILLKAKQKFEGRMKDELQESLGSAGRPSPTSGRAAAGLKPFCEEVEEPLLGL